MASRAIRSTEGLYYAGHERCLEALERTVDSAASSVSKVGHQT